MGAVLDGRYRLESLIGSGASGAVYRGTDLQLQRSVAAKLLHQDHLGEGLAAFEAEAMAASRVNHPNAVAIYDIGTFSGRPYLIMEEARGCSLARLLEEQPLPVQRTAIIAAQILDALDEAHRCGVIHGDLSSDNVIVGQDDHVKVIDFGLARRRDAGRPGRVLGTAEYLAPELIRGAVTSPATDIYACGVLLYELLVGRTPFAGAEESVVVEGHLRAVPTPPHHWLASCPAALGELVARALSKDAGERPSSAAAMRAQLLRAVQGDAARPPRLPLVIADVLIGREAEQAELIERVRSGSGAVFVTGPEGAGKRRLIASVARAVAPEVQLLVAEPPPIGTCPPWAPVLQLLRVILDVQDPTLADITRAVAVLGLPDRDVPGVAEVFGVAGMPRRLDREALRSEAMASVSRVLQAAARRLPRTAIALIDLERFDEPSRALAEILLERASASGLVVVVTTAAPVANEHRTLHLADLDRESSRRLLADLLPPDTDLPDVAPSRPAELVQTAGWIADGHLAAHLPTALVDIVSQRILRSDTGVRRAIQALAAIGGAMDRDLFDSMVSPYQARSVLGLLHVGEARAWLPSPLVARVARACTPVDVRRELHRTILEALGTEPAPAQRADHAEAAEVFDLAYSMYSNAGHDAFSRFDHRGAAHYYQRAAACARQLHRRGVLDSERRIVAATLFAAEALVDCHDEAAAHRLLDEVQSLATTPAQLAARERIRGLALIAGGHGERGRERLSLAIPKALSAGDLDLCCDAFLEIAQSLVQEGRLDAARDELSHALEIITAGAGWRSPSAPQRLWRVGHRLAELALSAGDVDQARTVAGEALALARRRDSPNGQARLAALMADICAASGDHAGAQRYRKSAIAGLSRLGDRRSTAEVLLASVSAQEASDPGAYDLAMTLAAEIGWAAPQRPRSSTDPGHGGGEPS